MDKAHRERVEAEAKKQAAEMIKAEDELPLSQWDEWRAWVEAALREVSLIKRSKRFTLNEAAYYRRYRIKKPS